MKKKELLILANKTGLSVGKLKIIEKNDIERFAMLVQTNQEPNIEIEEFEFNNEEDDRELYSDDKIDMYGNKYSDGFIDGVTIYATVNLKGGSGKSTLADVFGNYLHNIKKEKVVILNLDIGQLAKNTNSSPTVDYVTIKDKYTVVEYLYILAKEYTHIIIDTPGEISEYFMEVVHYSNNIILPCNPGKRNRDTTITTLKTYLGKNSEFLKGKINLYIILNNYNDNITPKDEIMKLHREIKDLKFNKNISLNIKYTGLKFSKTITTIEDKQMSIHQLYDQKPGAYRITVAKMNDMSEKIMMQFSQKGI